MPSALKGAIFELRMVGSDGREFAVSSWDDDPAADGHPTDLARLMDEVTGLCVDPGDRGMLYSYPTPQERDDIRYVATFGPTGGDRYVAIRKALRGMRDAGEQWVTPGVIERVSGLVHSCDLMHLAEAWVIDALDAEPTYPGEGKDWDIAAIMRAIHAELVKIGEQSFAVETENDVLTVERTWPWQEWPTFGVPPCEDCQAGVQHIHWSGDPDPSLRDTV